MAEALELTLLLVEDEPEKYERAAARWHVRFTEEIPHVELRESLAVIALLAAIPANRLAAAALASAGDAPASESPKLLSAGRKCRKTQACHGAPRQGLALAREGFAALARTLIAVQRRECTPSNGRSLVTL